jgi:hypothetical protein
MMRANRPVSVMTRIVVSTMAFGLVAVAGVRAEEPPGLEPGECGKRLTPIPIRVEAVITPIPADDAGWWGDGLRACPPVIHTYSSADFSGGSYNLQAGFVAGEILAASYVLDADAFPVHVTDMEAIFAHQATVQTTTHWSILVWSGTPDTGTIVASFSSDGELLPHIVLNPGTVGVNVKVTVDPSDPEQIFVQDNGSHTFTIGYRVDQHNNPPTAPCYSGLMPAECCPPDEYSNAFPTTDVGGVSDLSNNWLYCRPNCGPFACPGGWHRFSSLGSYGPKGDWNIRVTYVPFTCDPSGACCDAAGTCTIRTQAECAAAGGLYVGDGTLCIPNPCDLPTGACCRLDGICTNGVNELQCNGPGETFHLGLTCDDVTCPQPTGACCDGIGGCLNNITPTLCVDVLHMYYAGHGTTCASGVCALGGCCLPDGSCEDTVEAYCDQIGGTFHETLCSSTECPQPLGACCLLQMCFPNQFEVDCVSVGGYWAGPFSTCTPDPCAPCSSGDVDGDGDVDLDDFAAFQTCFEMPYTVFCNCADMNNDNTVNLADYVLFQAALEGSGPQ